MSDTSKKIVVNGKEEAPIRKVKLPIEVDWQEIARKKEEAAKK